MNVSTNNNTNRECRLGKVSKRHFLRSKGNTSTALYTMLYKKIAQKGMPIPSKIIRNQNIKNEFIEKNHYYINTNNPELNAQQSLGELFPDKFQTIQEQYEAEISNLISSILKPEIFIHHITQNRNIFQHITKHIKLVYQSLSERHKNY